MKKFLRSLLLIAALLFSQHAAMLHGVAHAEHELALASHEDGKAPVLGHGADVCAAYGAIAHAVGNMAITPFDNGVEPGTQTAAFRIFTVSPRFVFDSRAPPYSA
jgi:hypothetical protein